MLIKNGNPKKINNLADILRDDVRMFISNPETERASYEVYRNTICNLASDMGLDVSAINKRLTDTRHTCIGESIHHREAPQSLYDGHADVAMVYYHLALRYTRIFPDLFDYIPLGGERNNPQPSPGNLTTTYHIGLMENGGEFGHELLTFMKSDAVTRIYRSHGLQQPESMPSS